VGEVEALGSGVVAWLEAIGDEVGDDGGPDGFAFTDDDAVGVLEGFVGSGGDVEAAHDDGDACGAIAVGELIGFADLGGEGGDGDCVEVAGEAVEVFDIGDFDVGDVEVWRGHACEGEEAEGGEGGDDLAAFDEAGEVEADGEEFCVLAADT
jgi:hypothetical protein